MRTAGFMEGSEAYRNRNRKETMEKHLKNGDRVSVAVVGAGPVGLTTALILTRAGIDVLLLEADPNLVEDLRTTIIHPSSLEVWSLLGATRGFAEYGTKCMRMQFRERRGGVVANLDYACLEDDTYFPYILLCALPFVVPDLHKELASTGRALVAFGHRVAGVRLSEERVTLTVKRPEGEIEIHADYVVAADGTRSTVRDAFAIARQRIAPGNRLYRITLEDPVDQYLSELESFSYVMDPICYGLVLRNPGFWRVPIGVVRDDSDEGGDVALAGDGTDLIRRFMFPDRSLNISAARPITVTNWIASDFGVGRILFAGDSAHALNPFAGMGMNSGVLDAVHAAIAVAEAVRSGRRGPHWRRYVQDRPRVARDIAVRSLTRYNLLTEADEARCSKRNSWLRELETDEARRRACLWEFSLLDRLHELSGDLARLVESARIPGSEMAGVR